MKVLITGGLGKCGTALLNLPCDTILMDRKESHNVPASQFIRGDINDERLLIRAMQGCDALIHSAHEWSHPLMTTAEVQYKNIDCTYQLLKAATVSGIERVIYMSSAHVVGMYELENIPDIYEVGNPFMIGKDSPIRPDSTYAMGKAVAEKWGNYFATHSGLKFYAIRLGAVCDEDCDHPYASAEEGVRKGLWKRNSDLYLSRVNRLKSKWLSRRDFANLIYQCLIYDGPNFDVFYGVSNNARRWLDIEYAKEVLNYHPQDNSEDWSRPAIKLRAKKRQFMKT